MLGQFATRQRMKIKDTCFPHTRIHMGTWSPDNNIVNHICHVLIEKRQASSIVDIRACRRPSLVKIKIKAKISKIQQKQREERRRYKVVQI
jgi:hypothetical protein